jgi:hypothetical protein
MAKKSVPASPSSRTRSSTGSSAKSSAANWHFLPWKLELKKPQLQRTETDILHQKTPLAKDTEVAVSGQLHTYLYVIHIGKDLPRKVTQLYPPAGEHRQHRYEEALRFPPAGSEAAYFKLPSAGDLRVVLSEQPIEPDSWSKIGVLKGRMPPPQPIRAGR